MDQNAKELKLQDFFTLEKEKAAKLKSSVVQEKQSYIKNSLLSLFVSFLSNKQFLAQLAGMDQTIECFTLME